MLYSFMMTKSGDLQQISYENIIPFAPATEDCAAKQTKKLNVKVNKLLPTIEPRLNCFMDDEAITGTSINEAGHMHAIRALRSLDPRR